MYYPPVDSGLLLRLMRPLERYSDFSNRLPRGRTYVRNGSVVDLHVQPGRVEARVSGSELYEVEVAIAPVPAKRWEALCRDCGGAVDSVVELLQGRFSRGVMERLCREGDGLFPSPSEIRMTCSCPDWATMCKHVAAVLYGIGARLDERPELLFRLRQVDEGALIASAGRGLSLDSTAPASARVLEDGDLSALFGVDLATVKTSPSARPERVAKPGAVPPAPAVPGIPPVPGKASPPALLEKGTVVRMLAGVYAGSVGAVSWVRQNGDRATYAVRLQAGRRMATTQVVSGSQGRMWELVELPSAGGAIPPCDGLLAVGTTVRMLSGMHGGCTGRIASANLSGGPRPRLQYTLVLSRPNGRRARTTVRHSSLGHSFVVVR